MHADRMRDSIPPEMSEKDKEDVHTPHGEGVDIFLDSKARLTSKPFDVREPVYREPERRPPTKKTQ